MDAGKITQAIDQVKSGKSPVELVWTTNSEWPLDETISEPPRTSEIEPTPFRISVLDSSYNPPTVAHKALAATPYPTGTGYQAHLLLLSVRNADKALKQGDATFVQRVDMMVHLAEDLVQSLPAANLAVGVIDEPSFVGKSTKLHAYLHPRLPTGAQLKLAFVMGTDTITRFFDPRFYGGSREKMMEVVRRFFLPPAQGGEGSEIVCARRSSTLTLEDEEAFLQTDEVKPWVDAGAIKMVDIGADKAKMSSTKVRNGVRPSPEQESLEEESNWRNMCCPSIVKYIEDHRLYCI